MVIFVSFRQHRKGRNAVEIRTASPCAGVGRHTHDRRVASVCHRLTRHCMLNLMRQKITYVIVARKT